jgi:hypothetical protein
VTAPAFEPAPAVEQKPLFEPSTPFNVETSS